jgi:adenylate kinase
MGYKRRKTNKSLFWLNIYKMNLILIGPQASGKGTYAAKINAKYHIPSISMGYILRNLKDEELRKEIDEKYLSKGMLVPDELTVKILKEKLEEDDYKKGFILDGFPRTLNQAKLLDNLVKIDLVIYITLSYETIVKRLSGRRQCSKCGAIYNINTNPPQKEGICDKCGGKLYIRDDDKPEAIKKRIDIFEKETKKVIEFYKEKGILEEVDGEPGIEEVFSEIDKVLIEKGIINITN